MQVVKQVLYKMLNTFTTHETKNKLGSVFVVFFFTKMTRRKKETTLILKKGHVEFEKTKHVPFIHSPD